MEIVKAAGLKKYYITDTYEVHALDGVTLSVRDGEFVAIVGTSGSGKTTLLNMLGGLDIPTEGGVWIRGNSLKDLEIEERTVFRRRNIGFVFQQYNLVPVLSVYENIVLPLRLDGAEIDYELLEEVTKLLGIHERLERLPDEPPGNLDSVTSTEVVGLLKSCAEKYHQTVIVVTHQEEVAQMADRVIRMEDGRICGRTECAKDDGKACSRTEWEEYIQNSGTISGQEG